MFSFECAGIEECREDYPMSHHETKYGVTFGFWENGFLPAEMRGKNPLEWMFKYPFATSVDKTSFCFQQKLANYLLSKTGRT